MREYILRECHSSLLKEFSDLEKPTTLKLLWWLVVARHVVVPGLHLQSLHASSVAWASRTVAISTCMQFHNYLGAWEFCLIYTKPLCSPWGKAIDTQLRAHVEWAISLCVYACIYCNLPLYSAIKGCFGVEGNSIRCWCRTLCRSTCQTSRMQRYSAVLHASLYNAHNYFLCDLIKHGGCGGPWGNNAFSRQKLLLVWTICSSQHKSFLNGHMDMLHMSSQRTKHLQSCWLGHVPYSCSVRSRAI